MIHIPSTQSLRVFCKAAETLNFSQSAEELYLTQSAVSQQIKQLEEQLHTPLFVRHRRGLRLSEAGQHFLKAIAPLLHELEASVASLRNGMERRRIVVRADSALLASGLIPNLSELARDMPVQLEASDHAPRDLVEERVVAVYLGREISEPDVHCTLLAQEETFAACSPSALAQRPVHSLDDLRHHRLLLVKQGADGVVSDWERWLPREQSERLAAAAHVVFPSRALAQSAALAGQGIALAGSISAAPHISSGALVQPLDRRVRCSDSYYFACAKDLFQTEAVQAVRDWIVGSVTGPRAQRRDQGAA